MNKLLSYLIIIGCFSVLFACTKEYSFEEGNVSPAAGSLWDSSGACLPDSVHGTFYNGVTPGSDTAFVEIQVNVTQTGSYSIASDLQDGFAFADSGIFSNTGINIIRLKPIGVPIIPTTAIFNISFDSTNCSFSVVIKDSTGTGLGGSDTTGNGGNTDSIATDSWKFATDSGGNFKGNFLFVDTAPDTLFGGTNLVMSGFTSTGDTVLTLAVIFPGDTIIPGDYYTKVNGNDTHPTAIFGFASTATGDPIYDAVGNPSDPSDVIVTIASYDAVSHVVTGTFSGTAMNETSTVRDATIQILNGAFSATIP